MKQLTNKALFTLLALSATSSAFAGFAIISRSNLEIVALGTKMALTAALPVVVGEGLGNKIYKYLINNKIADRTNANRISIFSSVAGAIITGSFLIRDAITSGYISRFLNI